MNKALRALCAHDLSGVGKCSLTVALPVLSAAGIEACPLPTALLSTQTGGIEGYTFLDLSSEIPGILAHWKNLGLTFDGIYTGFLASHRQIPLMEEMLKTFGQSAYVLIDPVMGDGGALYPCFRDTLPQGFRTLLRFADITTPNLTEACLLTGTPFLCEPDEEALIRLCAAVSALGPKQVVITGIERESRVGCAVWDAENSQMEMTWTPKAEGRYHGCGDLFASVLFADRLRGIPLLPAARRAADFVSRAVFRTQRLGIDSRFGLDFERDMRLWAAQENAE